MKNIKEKTTIGFTGDVSFSGYFKGCDKDNNLLDDRIKSFVNSNDYDVINFESPITPCRITKKRRLAHRCAPEALNFIESNFNKPILSFANNHMMDYGRIGMVDSVTSANQWNMPYIGAGLDIEDACKYVILGDDVKVGILGVEYKKSKIATQRKAGPFHESKKDFIKSRIDELKGKVDYIVIVYHGGDEFLHAPMPYIRKQLKKYLKWGCDIVVAHHPHVVQGYEFFGKKAIFYSLGNFIFDTAYQRMQEDTDKGIIIKINFYKDRFHFESLPTVIDRENHKVKAGDSDEYFIDISDMNYSRLWCTEAYRKSKVKQNAAELKEKEIFERERKADEDELRVRMLRLEAELRKNPDFEFDEEDEDNVDAEAENRNRSLNKTLKRFYKKYIKNFQKKYRAFIVKTGEWRARLFYR